MSNIVTIGYVTEGTTDKRFLDVVIRKTFEEIAFECHTLIEVFDPTHIETGRGTSYVDQLEASSRDAYSRGLSVLCVHVDSDSQTNLTAIQNKIQPAFKNIIDKEEYVLCKNLVAIVPVQMSESWMLADKQLFKEEIGTTLSDIDLGINRNPESFADPKSVIEEALRRAQANLPRRRNKISISDIYQPIGQKVSLQSLRTLQSYNHFRGGVRDAFIRLNFLR